MIVNHQGGGGRQNPTNSLTLTYKNYRTDGSLNFLNADGDFTTITGSVGSASLPSPTLIYFKGMGFINVALTGSYSLVDSITNPEMNQTMRIYILSGDCEVQIQ